MCTDSIESFRRRVLSSFGAGSEIDELLAYNNNVFEHPTDAEKIGFPLSDEPFVTAWEGYLSAAENTPVVDVLKKPIPQLCFPIREGISLDDSYRAV